MYVLFFDRKFCWMDIVKDVYLLGFWIIYCGIRVKKKMFIILNNLFMNKM